MRYTRPEIVKHEDIVASIFRPLGDGSDEFSYQHGIIIQSDSETLSNSENRQLKEDTQVKPQSDTTG